MSLRFGWGWSAAGLALLLLIAAEASRPWLPGDPALARLVQATLPASPGWAEAVSALGGFPAVWLLLVATAAGAAWLRGGRGVVAVALSFAGMVLLDRLLRHLVFQPRPEPGLIRVVGHPPGSAFPSTFALLFGATIGCFLFCAASRRRWLLVVAAVLALVLGFAARIALGAHWPSDVLVSYFAALLWSGAVLRSMKSAASAERHSPAETRSA